MQESRGRIDAGQEVTVRDEAWVVLGTDQFDASRLVHLRGIGDSNRDELRTVVSPFDVVDRSARSTRLQHVSRRRVLATAASAIADAAPWHECWTAAAARIELHAWQLEPAVAAINGATRILLADHVGLGKTIQATLIVAELFARRLAHRVLILTPASLREQWASEMNTRFGLSAVVFDQASLSTTVRSLPVAVNPWLTAPLIVSSIDLVKRPEVRAAIDRVAFDVLIVDEAHHVSPRTDRGALVADLAARTPWLVLVTATPHSGDDAAFAFLQRLGSPDGEALLTFRRCRPPTVARAARRSRLFMVKPTTDEAALFEEIKAYVHAVRRTRRGSAGAALVASVIARRASSCANAASLTLKRRRALLSRNDTPESQPGLPWEEADSGDAELDDLTLASAGLADVRGEVDWLGRIAMLADQAAIRSSKVAIVRRLLERTSEQVLIYTEYRDVAQHVTAALADIAPSAALHGGLSPRERGGVIDAFNRGQLRVVVATDAAGEGLNLHHRCRLVINLELPWMPRRLEQRIGRVDRLGQTKRVHAIQLVHRDSFEGTVVARLERRRATVAALTADISLVERETTTSARRQLRLAISDVHKARPRGAFYASRPRASAHHSPSVSLLYSASVLDGYGRVVQTRLLPLTVFTRSNERRTLTRARVREIALDRRVQNAVRTHLSAQVVESPVSLAEVAAALERRISACLAAVESRRGDAAWQGSLFDRHAEQRAHLHAAALNEMRTHLRRISRSTSALNTLRTSEPRLIAAWIGA